MPRLGTNPAKNCREVVSHAEVALLTIVHIPALEGYWEYALDVLRKFFASSRQNTAVVHDVYVFDNNSCAEVLMYLESLFEEGEIDYLFKSRRNVGKVAGWNVLFGACQSKYMCYADSDVVFYEDYLREGLKVLEAFPRAGMVTCQPIAGGDMTRVRASLEAREYDDITITEGVLVPDDQLIMAVRALGKGDDEIARRNHKRIDVRLERCGVAAYSNASHFQFITTRDVVAELFPSESAVLLGGDIQFEDDYPKMKWWRLCTVDYLVHHIGNQLVEGESQNVILRSDGVGIRSIVARARRLLFHSHVVRRTIKTVHAATYKMLYK